MQLRAHFTASLPPIQAMCTVLVDGTIAITKIPRTLQEGGYCEDMIRNQMLGQTSFGVSGKYHTKLDQVE